MKKVLILVSKRIAREIFSILIDELEKKGIEILKKLTSEKVLGKEV